MLTPEEKEVLELLALAFRKASLLDVLHSHDAQEFTSAIHHAQNIILSRPAMRGMWPNGHPSLYKSHGGEEPK
jgi:hypothetical protein